MAKTFLLAALFLSGLPALMAQVPQTGAGDVMNQARVLLQKWAETERMAAAERSEWEQGKMLLEGRINLVQQSIEELRKKIAEAEGKLEEARKRAAEVEAEKKQAKEATEEMLAQAAGLEKAVRGVLTRIPGYVQQKVKVLADRIPAGGAEVKNITAAERYQNLLGIVNEVSKANLEIASLPEIHEVGGGKKAEVKTIYVGLGQGYFVNAAGNLAGVGTPAAGGWVWRTDAEIAPKMLEVAEVMKKSITPKLVELPATIE